LKNRHFRVHSCSSPFVLLRSQPPDLLVFLLVSCWYRENKRSQRLSLFRIKELSRRQERRRVRQSQADQDRRRLPRRPTELRQGRVESRQDFRRDRRLALSLRHAGREQAWQRCLEALADGLPLPWPPENLLHRPLRQRQGWDVLARRRAARARQSQRSAQGRQRPKHREAARQAQAGRRPAFRAMGRRVARKEEG
jgi:hypothetical protein